MWSNNKIVFSKHHAQLPTPIYIGNGIIRMYYSTKIQKKSYIRFFDLCEKTLRQVSKDYLALKPGPKNTFSCDGVMPSCIVTQEETNEKFLFFTGWSLEKKVPYSHAIGICKIKKNGKLKNLSSEPILSKSQFDPCLVNSACVWKNKKQKKWLMLYSSGRGWIDDYPVYDIRKAECHSSSPLGPWIPMDQCVISHNIKDEAISRVWKHKNFFYYSLRTKYSNYSIKKTNMLKKYELKLEKNSWDEEMQCYPAIYERLKYKYLFYNGNNYGKTGICVAKWKK